MKASVRRIFLLIFSIFLIKIPRFVIAQPAERTPSVDPHHYLPATNPCYDETGQPQRCVPDFINAAFNLGVEVTNTCGERQPTRFCVQSGHMGMKKVCDICDSRVPQYAHPATYLTDFNNPNNETWWQSETMNEGMQYPHSVNLTLRLGKSFDITYVRLKFISPRPESFAIYKRTKESEDWTPWIYYSASCRSTYKLTEKAPILPGNEDVAQCTREFSDISPLTGGNIAFSTLEGRPSAENFEESEVLQKWVTTTEIMIVLNRMNTFGDEVFRDKRVLSSYYYAISDFAVGGRCKCNGHASQCVKSTGEGGDRLVCDCKHFTTGTDCDRCEPFYVDRPWRAATSGEANECLPCQCNHLSRRCYFDEKLYNETGHGGHCIDCAGNTQGPHCEECVSNHWRRPGEHYCTACNCDDTGSLHGQCDDQGQCPCKAGIGGQRCDQCLAGFYEFTANGCKDCQCAEAGSFNNTPECSPSTGDCTCKANVEGQKCASCKPGHFNLSPKNQFGCTPCFCFGHSSVCNTSEGYYATNLTSDFLEGTEQWTAGSDVRLEDVTWVQLDKSLAVSQIDDNPVYFHAPSKFLGDLRLSYNQDLVFTLHVQLNNPYMSKKDVVIVGANGQELILPIFAQGNPLPATHEQTFRYRIHANHQLQWNPSLREIDFIGILSNVTALKIRGTYSRGDVGYLSEIHLGSASLAPSGDNPQAADWVESCKCTEGFVGQFCESCAPGYKRAYKFGGPLTKCIKCECHSHSDSCDAESGACICQHNTAGDTCERCARGYYGDALVGTEGDCQKCDCPEDGPCILLNDGDTFCTECPEGYTGKKCDTCADEYFGKPLEGKPCKKCDCSGNTDPNSIGNCDSLTGECKKCIYHTTGFNCEKCEPGYWGDALLEPKGDCKACNCYAPATKRPSIDYEVLECRQDDGQCDCQPNVIGLHCDQCKPGFFNLTSGSGCQDCNCDPLGSINGTCDLISGQCQCKKGVTGLRCDQCAPRHFGFSSEGCKPCECDYIGSESDECDVESGQCLCKDSVEGRRCDQCMENRYNMRAGCLPCDDCYTLIQTRKNSINATMSALRENLDEIQNNPVSVNDTAFDGKVADVQEQVNKLHDKAGEKLVGDNSDMITQVNNLKEQLDNSLKSVKSADERLKQIDSKSSTIEYELKRFNTDKGEIQNELGNAIDYVNNEGQTQLQNAKKAAERYGDKSQQLSDMAAEAKSLADKQEDRKKEIKELADKSANISRQAKAEADDAIYGASKTSQQIADLQSLLKETMDLLNQTTQLSEEQTAASDKAYDEAAHALSNVEGLKLPNILPDELKNQSNKIKEESKTALQNSQEKVAENKGLLEDAQRVLNEAREEIRNAKAQQVEADRLLNDVKGAHSRAQDAFELATNTWNEAKDSLDILSDFKNNVDASKEQALKELEQLPQIEKDIQIAEDTTKETEDAIGDAKNNADSALNIAKNAQEEAELVKKKAEQLIEDLANTRKRYDENQGTVDKVTNSINTISNTTKDFENQAISDSDKTQEVLRKATVAETNAIGLQEKLTESEKLLNAAWDQLNSLDDVNDDQLEELNNLLEETEKGYETAALERQIKAEKDRRAEQEKSYLKKEIDVLQRELQNLQSIYAALPTKCFNVINLEQEGQK